MKKGIFVQYRYRFFFLFMLIFLNLHSQLNKNDDLEKSIQAIKNVPDGLKCFLVFREIFLKNGRLQELEKLETLDVETYKIIKNCLIYKIPFFTSFNLQDLKEHFDIIKSYQDSGMPTNIFEENEKLEINCRNMIEDLNNMFFYLPCDSGAKNKALKNFLNANDQSTNENVHNHIEKKCISS